MRGTFMKKPIALFAGLAAAALALAGCSASPADSEAGKTIELWTSWTPDTKPSSELPSKIEEWAEANGYTVNQSNFTYDQIHEKIIASAAGGNLPDVIWGIPEYVGEFGHLGLLADLTSAWESWEDAGKVSDSVKEAMSLDGQVVGFPYQTVTRAYLTHDDMLAEAGIEVPETWEDVLAVGTDVEDATGNTFYGLTGTGARAPQELLVYLAQYDLAIADLQDGGGYRNTWLDNPEDFEKATKVFQFYKDLLDSGAVSKNSPTYGWEQTDENFVTGLNATFVSGNWLASREVSNEESMADISVHQIPYPSDGQPATYLEAKPIFVMAGSDSLEASTELALQFASEDWQTAAWPTMSALDTVTTDSKWSKDFAELIDVGISYPPISLGEVTQAMIDSLAMVLQNGDSPEDAANWLSEAINTALENSGEAGNN